MVVMSEQVPLGVVGIIVSIFMGILSIVIGGSLLHYKRENIKLKAEIETIRKRLKEMLRGIED
jgi:uncharacterized integral membrane protein